MEGPDVLVNTLSVAFHFGKTSGNVWQYHPQSDRHSKAACWGILFDLLLHCEQFRTHVAQQKLIFGVNHRMTDFTTQKRKNLDLVIATPGTATKAKRWRTFDQLPSKYQIPLTPAQTTLLTGLPPLSEGPVGNVLVALEAKATMTAHIAALPRLFDELNSSHAIVHGASTHAIAAGFAIINHSPRFVSPKKNPNYPKAPATKSTTHKQPHDTEETLKEIGRIPRRSGGRVGFDAMGIVVVDLENDPHNVKPATLITSPPAPQPGTTYYYDDMINRICHEYSQKFSTRI